MLPVHRKKKNLENETGPYVTASLRIRHATQAAKPERSGEPLFLTRRGHMTSPRQKEWEFSERSERTERSERQIEYAHSHIIVRKWRTTQLRIDDYRVMGTNNW